MSTYSKRYISNELTHFVGRGLSNNEQYVILTKILKSGWLTSPPHDLTYPLNLSISYLEKLSKNSMYSPQMVCFCDIPVEHLSIHITKYSPFGLAFNKQFIIKQGGAPVRYIPKEGCIWRGRDLDLEYKRKVPWLDEQAERAPSVSPADYFDDMVNLVREVFDDYKDTLKMVSEKSTISVEKQKLEQMKRFLDYYIFCYLKFFNSELSDDDPDNYYFEREWRVLGNINFDIKDVKRVLLPNRFVNRFKSDFPNYKGHLVRIKMSNKKNIKKHSSKKV